MRRTASHVVSSPNPAQLEMRILANHGGDSRFAFLRGRWSRAWKTMKGRVRLEKDQENVTTQKGLGGMGGLSGYGESDDESTHDVQEEGTVSVPLQIIEPEPKAMDPDDAIKEARRARAKEWAERRRTRQSENADHSG